MPSECGWGAARAAAAGRFNMCSGTTTDWLATRSCSTNNNNNNNTKRKSRAERSGSSGLGFIETGFVRFGKALPLSPAVDLAGKEDGADRRRRQERRIGIRRISVSDRE